MFLQKKNNYIFIIILVILLLIIVFLYNQKNKEIKSSILNLEKFRNNRNQNNNENNFENNLIKNGDFTGGKQICNHTHFSGINRVVRKKNPSNSSYVLEQINSSNKTYYEIQINGESNQHFLLELWVSFHGLNRNKDFRNLVKINANCEKKIIDIKNINYNVDKKLNLGNNTNWYHVKYSFKSPEEYCSKINIYLNYTTNLQAKKIYFSDIGLFKVLKDAINFQVIENLTSFLDGKNYTSSSISKKWKDISNHNNNFVWSKRPIINNKKMFINTLNNKLHGNNAKKIIGSNDGFSIVLVFSSNDKSNNSIFEDDNIENKNLINILTLPGNNRESIKLFMPNGKGKIKVVFNNKGEFTKYSRPLRYYNKTVIVLTYKNRFINVYQDSVRVIKNMKVDKVHISNQDIKINENGKWNAKLFAVLFYNDILSNQKIKGIYDYFINSLNKNEDNSLFIQNRKNNGDVVSLGSEIYDYDNSFSQDIDNINCSIITGKKEYRSTIERNCKTNCREMCRPFIENYELGNNLKDYNKCISNCKNTIKACKCYCSFNNESKFCKLGNTKCPSEKEKEDCPLAYKRNGNFVVYIQPNTKYEVEMGFSGEKSYGNNRSNARKMYEINFPNCEVPSILKPNGGKNCTAKCPFRIKENNPCYSNHCANIDWTKKNNFHKGMSKKCKHLVANYCEINNDIDDSCLCWRDKFRNLPGCRKFRRKFQNPKDYQCNIKDFNIEEHPKFNRYIRRDRIPCWNCNIPK